VVSALTQGGPGQATNILVYKVYNDGFRGQDLGGSSAQSVILMVVVIALTFVQFPFHRAAGPLLMVENRPWLTAFSHLVVISGRDRHRLPGLDDLRRLDPRPGNHAAPAGADLARHAPLRELSRGDPERLRRKVGSVPLANTLFNSLVMPLGIVIGKLLISIIAALPSSTSGSRCA
jgi:ABC-type sugar transport system permease subunit